IELAMEEAVDQRESVVHPPLAGAAPQVTLAHAQLLRESEAGAGGTPPPARGGGVGGAVSLGRPAGPALGAPPLRLCEARAAVAGPIVELKVAAERNLASHALESGRALWRKVAGPRHPGYKLAAAGTLLAALFFTFATGEFRVSAESTVEGEVQRVISAPIN